MLLYRLAAASSWAVSDDPDASTVQLLESDPFGTPRADWRLGAERPPGDLLAPVRPPKIVGIGRNYRDHAAELGNPMPEEPLLFLKAPTSVVGPGAPIVLPPLPPGDERVEFEGEIAAVVGRRIHRAGPDEAAAALLGVTCAVDVTARAIQRKDATFARGKSFDTFCPLGPAIRLVDDPAELEALEVVTRVDGRERQRGRARDMAWGIVELVGYVSRHMTLEPGDVLLTGTPAGVGPLAAGETIEVDVTGVGTLKNPVVAFPAEGAPR